MTTDLLKLTAAVTSDSADTLLQDRIRDQIEEIKKTLEKGEDYELESDGGKIIIRAKKTVYAKSA